MIYASSKDELKKRLVGIATEVQANDMSGFDMRDVVERVSKVWLDYIFRTCQFVRRREAELINPDWERTVNYLLLSWWGISLECIMKPSSCMCEEAVRFGTTSLLSGGSSISMCRYLHYEMDTQVWFIEHARTCIGTSCLVHESQTAYAQHGVPHGLPIPKEILDSYRLNRQLVQTSLTITSRKQ